MNLNSFISWIGGKNYLKKAIAERIPANLDRYIEVFGGAGWVLFYRDSWAGIEVYNDYNGELVNLFRCVKYHRPELQRELSWVPNSRRLFNDFIVQKGLTDIQRAARFYFTLKVSYGANGRTYGSTRKNLLAMKEYLLKVENRLAAVIIEEKDFEELIHLNDRPEAFFYLDPPYYGTEAYYQVQFTEEDHLRLARLLRGIKGRFLLSYNDCEVIRELYKDYTIEEITRQHNLRARYPDKSMVYSELLIRNYDIL